MIKDERLSLVSFASRLEGQIKDKSPKEGKVL
jgi:hypothetical protein